MILCDILATVHPLLPVLDLRSNILNHTHELMAQNITRLHAGNAIHIQMQITATNSSGRDLQHNVCLHNEQGFEGHTGHSKWQICHCLHKKPQTVECAAECLFDENANVYAYITWSSIYNEFCTIYEMIIACQVSS